MNQKKCTSCLKEKLIYDFYLKKKNGQKRASKCRDCIKKIKKDRYKNNSRNKGVRETFVIKERFIIDFIHNNTRFSYITGAMEVLKNEDGSNH